MLDGRCSILRAKSEASVGGSNDLRFRWWSPEGVGAHGPGSRQGGTAVEPFSECRTTRKVNLVWGSGC